MFILFAAFILHVIVCNLLSISLKRQLVDVCWFVLSFVLFSFSAVRWSLPVWFDFIFALLLFFTNVAQVIFIFMSSICCRRFLSTRMSILGDFYTSVDVVYLTVCLMSGYISVSEFWYKEIKIDFIKSIYTLVLNMKKICCVQKREYLQHKKIYKVDLLIEIALKGSKIAGNSYAFPFYGKRLNFQKVLKTNKSSKIPLKRPNKARTS